MLCIATQSVINTDLLSCSKSFFLYSCCQLEIDMMSFIDLIHFWLNKINIFPLLNNLPILTFSSRRRGILPAEAAELRRRVISWFVPLLAEKKKNRKKKKKSKKENPGENFYYRSSERLIIHQINRKFIYLLRAN